MNDMIGLGGSRVRVANLRISNFRCLPDFEARIGDHCVLIGPNDSGKSSILRALHLLLGLPHSQLVPSVTLRDFSDPTQPIVIEAVLTGIDDDDRWAFPDEIHVDSSGGELLTIRLEADVDPGDPDSRSVRRSCPDAGSPKQVARSQLDLVGWELLSADRSLRRELGSTASGTFRSLLSRIDLGEDGQRILQTIEALHELLADANSLQELREGLAAGLSEMLPRGFTVDDFRRDCCIG
jgi:putative ATP-dependent endonuclease of OLD family